MGENNSQFYGEKPIASRNPFNAKSNIKLYSLIANEDDKRDELTNSDKTNKKSANLVKIKFPTISSANKTDFDNASPGNLFASSSFVKSENTYKDTIKSWNSNIGTSFILILYFLYFKIVGSSQWASDTPTPAPFYIIIFFLFTFFA